MRVALNELIATASSRESAKSVSAIPALLTIVDKILDARNSIPSNRSVLTAITGIDYPLESGTCMASKLRQVIHERLNVVCCQQTAV